MQQRPTVTKPRATGARPWLVAVLAVASLAVMFGPSLADHARQSQARFNDDCCQHLTAFLRPISHPVRDYTEMYWQACLPVGARLVYRLGAAAVPLHMLSRYAPYVLLLAALFGASMTAHRFAGMAGAWAVAALMLSADTFLSRMVGWTPRAYAFPLLAWVAFSAVSGNVWLLAALVCLSAALYPAVAVCAGLALAVILALPSDDRGCAAAWSLRRRALVLSCTAATAAAIALPTLLAVRGYGPPVSRRNLAQLPEAQAGGRLVASDRSDFGLSLFRAVQSTAPLAVHGKGRPWSGKARAWAADGKHTAVLAVLLVAAATLGAAYRIVRCAAARRLLALTLAVMVAYLLARAMSPRFFLPQRHLVYAAPLLSLLWSVAGISALPRAVTALYHVRERSSTPIAAALTLAMAVACLLVTGGRVYARSGLTASLERGRPLFDFLATLPGDAFIAGWPNWMAAVPYASKRAVLVSYETHLPYHTAYTLEMRRRMRLLIDAYFADDVAPIERLRDDMGVTHLVVHNQHLAGRPPTYFNPFIGWTREAWEAGRTHGFEVSRQRPHAEVFAEGDLFVLELESCR